jgi:hypothetical protein
LLFSTNPLLIDPTPIDSTRSNPIFVRTVPNPTHGPSFQVHTGTALLFHAPPAVHTYHCDVYIYTFHSPIVESIMMTILMMTIKGSIAALIGSLVESPGSPQYLQFPMGPQNYTLTTGCMWLYSACAVSYMSSMIGAAIYDTVVRSLSRAPQHHRQN